MSRSDECLHCGRQLPPQKPQPCPYCGGTGRRLLVDVQDTVGMKDDLAIGITHGQTGRYALHADSAHPTDTLFIDDLVRKAADGRPDELWVYLDGLVAQFESAAVIETAFYRGVSAGIRDKIVGSQIGPSPAPSQGRYNHKGEKCIYLIDNLSFLSAEVGVRELLVQDFRVPLHELRVADLTPQNAAVSNSLSLVFQMTERGKTGAGFDFEDHLTNRGESRYFVSQLVADAFKRRGWQGLYIPGVHGEGGVTYRNLALFGDCVDRWQEWAIGTYRDL